MVPGPARRGGGSKPPPRRRLAAPSSQPQVISWRFSSAPAKPSKTAEPITPEPSPTTKQLPEDEKATTTTTTKKKKQQPEHRHELKDLQKSFALTRKRPAEPPAEPPPEPPKITHVDSVLDPFCVLPSDLTREDEQLLQFYLTVVSRDVYGTRSDAVFNPVRDISFALSLRSPMTLQWMLIAAAGFVAGRRGERPPMAIFRRKSIAYQTLRTKLGNSPTGPISDELIDVLIMATMTESRISQRDASNIHLRGYERAVQTRGGFKKMILASSTPLLFTSHLMPFLICEPPAGDIVLGPSAARHAIYILEIIAKGENTIDPSELHFTTPDPNSPTSDSKYNPSLKLNLSESLRLLLASSLLSRHLRPDFSIYSRYALQTAQYLSLFIVVTTLWRLRNELSQSKLFLNRLNLSLIRSGDQDSQGHDLLTMEGLMWITIKAAFDALQGNAENQAGLIVDSMSTLKLFGAANEDVRRMLVEYMYELLSEGIDRSVLIRNSELAGAMSLRSQDYGNFSRDIDEIT